ncbi:sex peptide receptor-like [Pecten maximus]|uniref:sex peptide receptor-like n=1 Tax=Pecten maximus TaxID=6579 RepID=UPI001458B68A|nr:sex peptide receptor-like [Pecten maximus]
MTNLMVENCLVSNMTVKFGMEKSSTSHQANHRLTIDGIDRDVFIVNFEKIFRYHFEIYIYGYAWPLVALVIVVLNSILLYIFAKKRMMTRNVTHLIIGAICLFDMLTLVLPGLAYVYVFGFLGIVSYLPYNLCSTWYFLTEISPTVCHSTANLLTVTLAFQRCLSITYPLQVGRWCTTRRTFVTVIGCFVICIVPEIVNSFMVGQKKVDMPLKDNTTFAACSVEPVNNDVAMAYFPHVIVWLLGFKIIPCILLIVFGAIMIRQLRKATRARCYLLQVKNATAHQHHREAKLTVMISWVIGIFLVFEVPGSILVALYTISMVFHVNIICRQDLETTLSFMYILVILTFISNFVIYCVCSSEFRTYLKHMIPFSRNQKDKEIIHSKTSNISIVSLTSENGDMPSTSRDPDHTSDVVNDTQAHTLSQNVRHDGNTVKTTFLLYTETQNGTTCGDLQDGGATTNEGINNSQRHTRNGSMHQMSSYL